MAVSNSRDFNIDVTEAIEEAYERCGGEGKTGYSLRSARRSLNIMLAEWANRGINLFTVEQVTTTLTAGTANYTLGIDTIDILEMVIRRSGTDTSVDRISRSAYLNYLIKQALVSLPSFL